MGGVGGGIDLSPSRPLSVGESIVPVAGRCKGVSREVARPFRVGVLFELPFERNREDQAGAMFLSHSGPQGPFLYLLVHPSNAIVRIRTH